MKPVYIKSMNVIFLLSSFSFIYAQKIPDSEIKKNITRIDNPLEKLVKLEPATFEYNNVKYKDLKLPSGTQYGFVAENLQMVFPELVTYRNFSYSVGKNSFRTAKIKDIDVESIIPILVASIQEQQTEIEKLKTELQTLKNKNSPGAIQ
ncbi:MAG: tail fiber domain-containing protein [Bacteroidota bacterium]